jgi:hypothetical protein
MAHDPADGEGREGDVADRYACWFEHCDELVQGTVLRGVRVFEESVESTPDQPNVAVRFIDAVVLTQSCDIPKPAQTRLLVAEVHRYRDVAAERGGMFRGKAYRKQLVDGLAVAEFVIPPADSMFDDWSIVNFRELYTVDRDSVLDVKDEFMALASPYREHLGQAFARFMMRVGLPTGLDEFEQYKL